MRLAGTAILHAPPEKVWETMNDPAMLARLIPGCEELEVIGPDAYRVRATVGVASIKGTYQGEAAMVEQDPPHFALIRGSGGGIPGTMSGECRITLEEVEEGTKVSYDAEGIVGGVIAGVGQRVLLGVGKKMAAEAFKQIDDILTGKAPAVPAPREPATASDLATGVGALPGATAATSGVFAGSGAAVPSLGLAINPPEFVKGAVFGAAVALAGVLVGGFLGRSRLKR